MTEYHNLLFDSLLMLPYCTVGSSYREHNQNIFRAADVAVSVAMIPGDEGEIPPEASEVISKFPDISSTGLTKADLLLHLRLIALGSVPLLQSPAPWIEPTTDVPQNLPSSSAAPSSTMPVQSSQPQAAGDTVRGVAPAAFSPLANGDVDPVEIPFSLDVFPGASTANTSSAVRMSALLEGTIHNCMSHYQLFLLR